MIVGFRARFGGFFYVREGLRGASVPKVKNGFVSRDVTSKSYLDYRAAIRQRARDAGDKRNRLMRIGSASSPLSPDLSSKLMRLQRGKCACCKAALAKTGYHLDHVKPLSRGGLHADSNIQLLCPQCNFSKHCRDPIDFMQSRGYLI